MTRLYKKTATKHLVKQRKSVQRYLADMPAQSSRDNALYYLDKFERYLQANKIAVDLDQLMDRRAEDQQGHVTHWEIMRNFLVSPDMAVASYNTLKNARACISNWYALNNLPLQNRRVKFGRERRIQVLPPPMTLQQARQLILDGKPNAEMKAVLLTALQTGMGLSEIFWSLGKDGMEQLTNALGPDVSSWNFEGVTPLKIEAIRRKTGQKFYTFVSRDGLDAIKVHLLDTERRTNRKMKPTDRLFRDLKWPSVFTANLRNMAIRAGLNGQHVQAGGSKYAKRYAIHLHALRALFKTVCRDAGMPDAISEFLSGRDWQIYHYTQEPYLVDADGRNIGEEHFREQYRKVEPRLNVLTGSTVASELEKRDKQIEELEDRLQRLESISTERVVLAATTRKHARPRVGVRDHRGRKGHRL